MDSVIPFISQSIQGTQMCRHLHLSRFARPPHGHRHFAPTLALYPAIPGSVLITCLGQYTTTPGWPGISNISVARDKKEEKGGRPI